MSSYVPLTTDDYRVAFCQAIDDLPEDCKRIIWNKTIDIYPEPPATPIKKPPPRLNRMMKRWETRRQI